MSSVLQSLLHTPVLREFFLSGLFLKQYILEIIILHQYFFDVTMLEFALKNNLCHDNNLFLIF